MIVVILGAILIIVLVLISRAIIKHNRREAELNELDNFEEISETISRNTNLVDRQDILVDKQNKLKEKVNNVENKLRD